MTNLRLNGAIVDAWFDDPFFAPEIERGLLCPANRVADAIRAADKADGVELYINSPGGLVDAAREISAALSDLRAAGAPVRIVVGALAASAAAEIVLQAPTGAEVLAHVNSRLMFHSATVPADGGPDAHRAAIADLESANEPTIEALVAHGVPRARVEAAFRDDGQLWMTARAAEEFGIVDGILGDEAEAPAVADPEQAARIAKPTAQLERLAERVPLLSRVSRLAALGVAEPDPATVLDAAPAEDPATPSAETGEPSHAATETVAGEPAEADPATPAEPAPAPEDPATPAPAPAAEPEPAPAPEAEAPADPASAAPEAPPAPDARVEALRASLEKAELSARNIQSASGKKIAALERDLAAAIAERDAARAELEATRQSISDLTARADALAGLVETERTKRASLVGGALAPEGTVDTSVPPASATPCSDALDAIRSLDDRRAYAKAHAAEIAAERAAAARQRRRR